MLRVQSGRKRWRPHVGSAGPQKLPGTTQTEPRMYLNSSILPGRQGPPHRNLSLQNPTNSPSKHPEQGGWVPSACGPQPGLPGPPSPAPPPHSCNRAATSPQALACSPLLCRLRLLVSWSFLLSSSSSAAASCRHLFRGSSPVPASPPGAGPPGGARLPAAASSVGPASVATSEREWQPRESPS